MIFGTPVSGFEKKSEEIAHCGRRLLPSGMLGSSLDGKVESGESSSEQASG